MTLLLHYYRHAKIVAEFDMDALQLTQRPLAAHESWRDFDGDYDLLGHDIVALYRHRESLWLRVGARVGPIAELSLTLEGSGETQRRLIVTWTDGTSTTTRYEIEPEIPGDTTPMRDLEDSDFGLLCINVANDPGRQQHVFNQKRD